MSDAAHRAVSVLLPAARAVFFLKDPGQTGAAEAISEDWRFARVGIEVVEGDVYAASKYFDAAAPAQLIVIETDVLDESFTDMLEELAGKCDIGTAAIVIGPVNDVYLYRRLVGMGISDYLVRPVSTDVLADVVAKALIEQLGTSDSRLICLLGAKGGVGTSTLAHALGLGVSGELGQKTVLMDAAGGWSYLSVAMGVDSATTLSEAVRAAGSDDQDALGRMLSGVTDKLTILAAGGDPLLEAPVDGPGIERLLDRLMRTYPVIIADLSRAPLRVMKTVIRRAHEVVLVTTPTLPALRSARTLIQEVKELRGAEAEDIELVINMQGHAPSFEVGRKDIPGLLDHHVTATVSYDPRLFIGAESRNIKLTEAKGGDKVVSALLPLARIVLRDGDRKAEEGRKRGGGILGRLSLR